MAYYDIEIETKTKHTILKGLHLLEKHQPKKRLVKKYVSDNNINKRQIEEVWHVHARRKSGKLRLVSFEEAINAFSPLNLTSKVRPSLKLETPRTVVMLFKIPRVSSSFNKFLSRSFFFSPRGRSQREIRPLLTI